jgi:hypothetical protein
MMPHDRELGWRWRSGIPVIRRSPAEIHIGDLNVPLRLSTQESTWLRSIGESASPETVLDSCPTGPERARAIVHFLSRVGALAPPLECWWLPPEERARVQPHLAALSEWHRDPQRAIASRTTWHIAIHGDGNVADALGHTVAESGLVCAESSPADLTIIAGAHGVDAPEALLAPEESGDPSFVDHPHLPVSVYRGHASIGPLVVPGRTPCLQCLHLHRRDIDPDWPTLVRQWRAAQACTAVSADPLLARQAAITAVAMIRHWIDNDRSCAPHRIRWRLPDPVPRCEYVIAHPACGCRWSPRAPDAGPRTGASDGPR